MNSLKICKYGEPVLRQKGKPVAEITPEIRKLVRDMFATMYSAPGHGVGLAAPQVGVSLRICVIDVWPDGKSQPIVLINPNIVEKSGKMEGEEGCLSLPGLAAEVKRYARVKVEATNDKGFPVIVEGEGLLSRALQHEIDHLDGKLFIDYVSWLERKKIELEIKKRKKQDTW
jgi:peptide deformylase